jgi:hypothetical protein
MSSFFPYRRAAGGTLIEVLVAVSIFMIAMGAMFVLFQQSYQGFHFLEQRQSVQSQVLGISSALEADFRLTHLASVGVEPRSLLVGGETVHRDLVSCLTLDDWLKPANFDDQTGIPKWNRYAVYLSSLDGEGTLERVVYRPPGSSGQLQVTPLTGMDALNSNGIKSRQLLCENLLSMQCSIESNRVLLQTLRLLKKGAGRGLDNNKTSESFEARFRWVPKNTVPKI